MSATPLNVAVNRRIHSRRFAGRLVPDMTAMVGLGFLLVTFFIMAADFFKPTVVQLSMPVRPRQDDAPTGFSCGGAMTLILDKNQQIHYYFGLFASDFIPDVYTTNLGSAGLRQVLLELQQKSPNTVVLIKTTADARYKDMVDVLDEMKITNQKKYALVDITVEETRLLKSRTL